jgi:hypothetical protein
MLDKYFKEELNIWNEVWTCECKVSDSVVEGLNKTVKKRLQTRWLDGQIQVKMC